MAIRKEKPEPEIDVGPFSDIAFLLIIFFILTTTFVQVAGNKINIPSGTSQPEQKEKQKQLTVNLRGTVIEYGEKNQPMSLVELKDALLKEKFAERPEEQRMVVLDSREDVPYELYFQVVMAITQSQGIIALIEHDSGKEGEGTK